MSPDDVDLARVWVGLAARVWRRRAGPVERLAGRLLRSAGLARALVATPSLLLPWLLATAAIFAAGAVVTASSGQPFVALLAPAVTAAGIACAYGPGVDPAYELSCSTAVGERMVLLVRVLAVFAVNGVLGLAASVASPTAAGIAYGWLVPMTAVSALALATATMTRSPAAGVAAGLGGWVFVVVGTQAAAGGYAAALGGGGFVLPYLAVTAGGGAIAVLAPRQWRGAR